MKNRVEVNCNSHISRKSKDKQNIIAEIFNDYCSNTTIHGIGYIGARDKNWIERLWWIIVVLTSIICCCYLISRTWIKWKDNPVILSFEQEQTAVWQIPFPAVTVCPLNKVQQLAYNYTEMFRRREELVDEDYKQFWDISLICNLEQYDTPMNCTINVTDEAAIHNILSVMQLNQRYSVAPDLSDTFFANIKWQSKKYPITSKLFTEQITQEGLCFTFNSLSQADMYTNHLNHNITYINHSVQNIGWKLEDGYPPNSGSLNDHPQRTAKDGAGSGLRFVIMHLKNDTEFVCGPMVSGYKIILHNPAETPRPAQQYFLIPLDKQVALTVKPELTTTSNNLRSMDPVTRKCYFSNEKFLYLFKVYTQTNCRTECAVNVTRHICGCVPFYMPHGKKTDICGFGKIECVSDAEAQMLDFEMIEKGINASSEVKETDVYKIYNRCNCLPSCSDLQFSAETSQTSWHAISSMLATGLADEEMGPELIKQLQSGILSLTQVDIYFKASQFLALHRSELYGQTDFLANCGGLLGLCMGFSLISVIEILYFATIRLWMKCKQRRNTK